MPCGIPSRPHAEERCAAAHLEARGRPVAAPSFETPSLRSALRMRRSEDFSRGELWQFVALHRTVVVIGFIPMTKTLKDVLERAESWPDWAQQELVDLSLEIDRE